MTAELILLIALAVLVVAVWRPATRAIFGGLDSRAERIRAELEGAQRLREEAQAMLAQYQRKLHEAEAHAKTIVDHALEEVQRAERHSRTQIEQTLQRRTQQAMDRIAAAEGRALQDVRAQAASLSVDATRALLRANLEGDRARAVMNDALDEVRAKLG